MSDHDPHEASASGSEAGSWAGSQHSHGSSQRGSHALPHSATLGRQPRESGYSEDEEPHTVEIGGDLSIISNKMVRKGKDRLAPRPDQEELPPIAEEADKPKAKQEREPFELSPIVVLPPLPGVIRKHVSEDISKLLSENRAYVQHYRTPPVCSRETLHRVARPKYFGSDHPDAQLQVSDPAVYLKYKTYTMHMMREMRDEIEALETDEKEQVAEDLANWKVAMAQKKAEEEAAKAAAAAEKIKLGKALSRYVNARAKSDVKGHSQRLAEMKQRADKVHQEALAHFAAHS